MIRKASGRSALILAAGLMLCLGGPVRAVESGDATTAAEQSEESAGKPIALNKFTKSRARSKYAAKPRKSRGVLARGYRRKPMDSKLVEVRARDVRDRDAKTAAKSGENTGLDDKIMPVADIDQPLPDNVANANAQWPAPNSGTQPTAAAPVTPSPNMAASDQLSDVDKTLSETPPTAPVAEPQIQMAQTVTDQRAPVSQDKLMSAMAQADQPSVSSSDSAWGQSSTIGKIFIAVGGLLTFASAIRMFMA